MKQKKQKVDPLLELQIKYQNTEYALVDVTKVDQLKLKTELIKQHFSVTKLVNNERQLYVIFDRLNNKNLKQSLQSLKCDIVYFGTND